MPIGNDTGDHIKLAENLIKYKTFSLDNPDLNKNFNLPPRPTNFLTPAYALWLAIIYIIFHSFTPAIFIGAIIFSLSVPLTYFISREILPSKKSATIAAAIFLFEPLAIYHSGLMFTEQIFVPTFLLGAYFFIKYLKESKYKLLFSALVLFSVSTLIRPILFYFLPALVLIVIFGKLKTSWRQAVIFGFASFFLAYSIMGVWLIRNKIVLNTWQISSNQGVILDQHYLLLVKYGFSDFFERDLLTKGLKPNSVEYDNAIAKFAIKEIMNHKLGYLKIRAIYMPLFFTSSGYGNIVERLAKQPPLNNYFRDNFIFALSNFDFRTIYETLLKSPTSFYAIVFGAALWAFLSILAFIGLIHLFSASQGLGRSIIIFIGLLLFYFSLVASPLITARYRLPVNPFIFILAISGFYYIKTKFQKNSI